MSYFERKQKESFTYEQVSTSSEWVINHFLNRYPIVNVYVIQNGVERIFTPSEIQVVDMNTCKLIFPFAISGIAEIT